VPCLQVLGILRGPSGACRAADVAVQRAVGAEREMQELRARAGEMEAETQQALAAVERERGQLRTEREMLLRQRVAQETYAHPTEKV